MSEKIKDVWYVIVWVKLASASPTFMPILEANVYGVRTRVKRSLVEMFEEVV